MGAVSNVKWEQYLTKMLLNEHFFGNKTICYAPSLLVCSHTLRLRRRRKSDRYPPSTQLDNNVSLNSTPYLRR